MSLIVMDADFVKYGEIAHYKSLSLTRSYWGVGAMDISVDPRLPCALSLTQDRIVFLSESPTQAYLIEDVTLTRDKLTAKGTMLKGLAKRRVCVPPLTLPTSLWQREYGEWAEITEAATIRALMATADIMQGFTKPTSAEEGALFLDLTSLGAVYDWGANLGLGEVVSDLGAAQMRSKYQNFGWDRFTGDAESAYLHYAQNNLISPEDDARRMTNLVAAANEHRGSALPWQARFDKLDSLFEQIGQATGVGWDIVPDFANERFVFCAWQGADRTTEGSACVLSEKTGNCQSVTSKRVNAGSTTTCYVGGGGEDENRLILSVGGETGGVSRREAWAECGSVTDAELLRQYATSKIAASSAKHTLSAELIDSGACRYGRDYDVGDRVIVADAYGSTAEARVTDMCEVREGGKRTLKATLGDAEASLGEMLRRAQGAAR